MKRRTLQDIKMVWRRKLERQQQEGCKQTVSVNKEQSKYFSMIENLQEKDITSEGCSEPDITKFVKEEVGKSEQCEWLFQNKLDQKVHDHANCEEIRFRTMLQKKKSKKGNIGSKKKNMFLKENMNMMSNVSEL